MPSCEPVAAGKWLLRRPRPSGVPLRRRAAAACGGCAGGHLWLLEQVLAAAAEAVAAPGKLAVPALKGMRRGAGHVELASRVGRLSKLRNGYGHSDVGLAAPVGLTEMPKHVSKWICLYGEGVDPDVFGAMTLQRYHNKAQ